MSESSRANDVPAVPAASKKEPSTARGCLTVIVVAVVLGVIVTIAAGAGQGRPAADSAASYVRSVDPHAIRVRSAVTVVRTAIRLAVGSPSAANVIALGRDGTAAQDSLRNVREEFATRAVTGTVGDAEVDLFAAANDLKDAIASIPSPAEGRGSPRTALARPTALLENAVGEWNDAVQVIWGAAGASRGWPTIS